MPPTSRWKQLLDDRLVEAVNVLGAIPGVHGLIVGGSVGRGEPWPMSDIDLLPVYVSTMEPSRQVEKCQSELVDWWAASGHAQTLDTGWLAFTAQELRDAIDTGPEGMAQRMADPRWFHGLDKAYGGHAATSDDELTTEYTHWATHIRFHPAVVAARLRRWRDEAHQAAAEAVSLNDSDPRRSTHLLREAARALRMVCIEGWGERLGSMGREWTRFERIAERHGARLLADRIAALAGADPKEAAERAKAAPAWLLERIDLSHRARIMIGEDVTAEENARDQLAAFTVHVTRHRSDLDGPWTGSPDRALHEHLAELHELLTRHG
ncbi:nucleotidyltransferase domain-containing protein [Streptomyces marincola]|uniref:nucleotidyltransferase domain-containing protein n=1 Tax=Streptomyces marincola TaxID=2878388 RepID=UPI001CF5383E|nr:nucleotidyltransferase domain-containing protein [Streptomyces marincola]UCM91271.1 nucleotidyltransferase domain-containing protein [Streptomyces marincola]